MNGWVVGMAAIIALIFSMALAPLLPAEARSEKKAAVAPRDAKEPSVAEGEYLTTNQGVRMVDDDNSLKAGARGPTLMEDFHFRKKITPFDHERMPERVVHWSAEQGRRRIPRCRIGIEVNQAM